ncbi:MAG: VWA domain-containing protein [Pedosphaera sp.]|nr:VWA domain-containing protein [Pedosphaera sp.]
MSGRLPTPALFLAFLFASLLCSSAADVNALRTRALQGDGKAALELGNIYFEGRDVPKNLSEAGRWWRDAATKGNAIARENLIFLNPPKETDSYAPKKEVQFLGAEGKGHRLVFVIDKSGSMAGGRFQAARAALTQTLRALPPETHFMIYFFNHVAEPMPVKDMLPATPENITYALKWVESREVSGGTDPTQALRWAFGLRPDTVWLLTDGGFQDQTAMLRQINPQRAVRVNTIAFQDPSGAPQLKGIADENGGVYHFVK